MHVSRVHEKNVHYSQVSSYLRNVSQRISINILIHWYSDDEQVLLVHQRILNRIFSIKLHVESSEMKNMVLQNEVIFEINMNKISRVDGGECFIHRVPHSQQYKKRMDE
jgi:hypothetical protein